MLASQKMLFCSKFWPTFDFFASIEKFETDHHELSLYFPPTPMQLQILRSLRCIVGFTVFVVVVGPVSFIVVDVNVTAVIVDVVVVIVVVVVVIVAEVVIESSSLSSVYSRDCVSNAEPSVSSS